MPGELTDRQQEVLTCIKKYISKFGYAPSLRAIAERFDMTINGAASHVRVLESKGYVKRTPGVARGMVVVK